VPSPSGRLKPPRIAIMSTWLAVVVGSYFGIGFGIFARELFEYRWRTSPQPSWRRIFAKWYLLPINLLLWFPLLVWVGAKELW